MNTGDVAISQSSSFNILLALFCSKCFQLSIMINILSQPFPYINQYQFNFQGKKKKNASKKLFSEQRLVYAFIIPYNKYFLFSSSFQVPALCGIDTRMLAKKIRSNKVLLLLLMVREYQYIPLRLAFKNVNSTHIQTLKHFQPQIDILQNASSLQNHFNQIIFVVGISNFVKYQRIH